MITYRQGNDERANRALDVLQQAHQCCGSDGRLSYQNNVPLSCNMYSIGCLTRTMFFLDSCMDALASILFFFSILKLFIVMIIYSFLCINSRNDRKSSDSDHHSINHSTEWRHSSSFDSSSTENLAKKILISSPIIRRAETRSHEPESMEKRRVILNDYEAQLPNKRVQCAAPLLFPTEKNPSNTTLDHQLMRKLSSISEKTERTGTDGSDCDILHVKSNNQKRPAPNIATLPTVKLTSTSLPPPPPPPLPKKLPIIKHRNKTGRDDDNDSGRFNIDL